MTWLLICDTCGRPIAGAHTTQSAATGREIHHHPECTDLEAT